jgi:NDP-sugar pyrophosphorylase family protein
VPVVNRAFLEYQVALLRQHGIDDIVFATNYMADKIQSHFTDGSRFGVRMRYAVEEIPLGTGGAIRNAAELFPGESVAVFNGDILTDFDLSAILDFHANNNAMATITLQPVPAPNPFGVLILNESARVTAWLEPSEETKKALAQQQSVTATGTDMINAGFYVLNTNFIERIPIGTPTSVERDIFPPLLQSGAPVYGIAPGGFWMDLGHPEQLMTASRAILGANVKTECATAAIGSRNEIAESASIEGLTSIGSGVTIGPNSTITDCIVMDNVKIGANVGLSHIIIDENCTIEDGVVVEGRVIGPSLVIAAGSVIRQGSRM